MWEIKGKNNATKATVCTLEYNGEWMGESYVAVSVQSPEPVSFEIGDYIMYRGERFEINYDPGKIKSAPRFARGDAFKYENIKFNSLADELTRCDFLDVVPGDNQLHFTGLPKFNFYGGVRELAERMQANLDRAYGKGRWKVEVSPECSGTKEMDISVDTIKVQGALSILVNDLETYYTIKGRTITIGAAGIPAGHFFKYGKGNGLYEIEQNAEADQAIVTRLRAYGSTRNLPHRYYNKLSGADGKALIPDNMAVQYLMLPEFPYSTQDPFIDSPNISKLCVREGTAFFDGSGELEEIYPSIEGMTAEQLHDAGVQCNSEGALDEIVSAEQMSDNGVGEISEGNTETKASPPTFKVRLKDIGFDINDCIIKGNSDNPAVSFKSGKLGGREFEIVGCTKIEADGKTAGYELELNRVYDDGIKLWFPYSAYNAEAGDKFVLLYIEMPEVYIKAASQRLKEAAEDWLSKNDYSRSVYAPKVDEIFMARQHDLAMVSDGKIASLHDTLREGMLLLFEDEDFNIDASIFIDRLIIKEGGIIPTYEVVLKEEKTVGRLDKMQNQIDSLSTGRGQGSGGYTAAQIRSMIEAYGATRFLSKIKDDRSRGQIASDLAVEIGNFLAGVSGAKIGKDAETGQTFAEMDRLFVRVRAYFEALTIINAGVLAGKQYITPGGGVKCTSVEELDGVFRCYFLSEQDGEKTEAKIVAGDQAIAQMFNAKEGTSNKVSNHRYWRLVTAVSNDAYTDASGNRYGYIDLSKTDCEKDSDAPQAGDEIVQFGNRNDRTRQAAMVFSTVDADAPSIKLFTGIDHYSLADKDIISYGYDPVTGRAYFNCYGNAYIGNRDGSAYVRYTLEDGLEVKGKISSKSTIDGKTLDDYFSDKAASTFLVRYSSDKVNWHPTYVEGDMWMQTSDDGGKTWSDPILISASGYTTNLIRNSKGPFKLSPTEDGDHYSLNWGSTVHLEQGKTYTISAKTNAAKFEAKHGTGEDKCVLWIFSTDTTPTIWQIVSGTDMTTDGRKGHTFVWNHPTDTYFLRVNFYIAGDWWVKEVKVEEGTNASPQWTPNPAEMIGQDGADGKDGRYTAYQWAVNTDPNNAPSGGWQGSPMSAKPGEYVWMRSGTVAPPKTEPDSWDTPIRLTGDTGKDGKDGQSVYKLDLTNEMAGIACDADGSVVGPYPTAQASVHKGSEQLSSGVTYSIAQATGASASITASGLVEVTGITADTATIIVQAKVDGLTLQTSMSLYKVKPGADGANGSGFSDNMLKGTRDWKGWSLSGNTFTKDGSYQGLDAVHGVPNPDAAYSDLQLPSSLDLEPDTVYTFSVWAKGEGEFVSYIYSNVSAKVLYIDGGPSGHTQSDTNATHHLTSEWKHYSVIFSTLDRTDLQNKHVIAARIFSGRTKEIWVAGAKVEKGENHTPSWSPHPSEMVGKDGEAAVVYALEPSVNNITKDGLGNLSAKSVTCSVYKTTGASTRVLTTEKTLTYLRVPDGANGTLPHASGTSSAIDILPATESVIFELKDGNTILDRERIPVLTDASGLEDGGVNILRNSAFEATKYWGISSKYSSVFSKDGLPVGVNGIRFEVKGLTEDAWVGLSQSVKTGNEDMTCHEGEYLTVSFRYKFASVDKGVYVALSVMNSNGAVIEYGNEMIAQIPVAGWLTYANTILCPPGSATFSLQIQLVRNGVLEIAMPQVTRGNRIVDWRPSPLDFSYITEALKNTFEVNGGLVLASLIKLGYTDDNEAFRIMAGLSGIYANSERGGGLAMWAGGEQIDAADNPTSGATFGVRHDGTAYACKNVIRFEPNQVAVGDGVFLGKDGLRLQVGASMKAHITNKPVSIDLAELQSNVNTARLQKDFVYGLRVYGGSTFIKTAPAKSERVSLGELTEGATVTLHITGTMKHTYNKTASSGSLVIGGGARPVNPLGYIRFSSIDEEPAINADSGIELNGSRYTATYKIDQKVMVTIDNDGPLFFTVIFPEPNAPDTTKGQDSNCTLSLTIDAEAVMPGSGQTLIGNNGMSCAFGNSALAINENGVVMRFNKFAMRVTEAGLQITRNGGGTNGDGWESI